MSGGQLVVLDRLGRDVKRYPLPEGLATLGSDPACDIRIMLPTVSPHHATVVVHANQTVVRNVSSGETLVNGAPVSVAALRHGDAIGVGGRLLRWEYSDAHKQRPLAPQPALYTGARGGSGSGRRRRGSAATARARSPALRLALELQARASLPPPRQVAIVQPQRRDLAVQSPAGRASASAATSRLRAAKSTAEEPAPRSAGLQGPTKASLWIESRKSPRPRPRAQSAKKRTPLRLAVLRRAQSVTKIQAPLTIDHTKQAAILLMARHTPRRASPPLLPLPRRPPRASPAVTSASAAVTSAGAAARTPRGRPSRAAGDARHVRLVELSASSSGSSRRPRSSRLSSQLSPLLPSPKKSALKDPTAKKSTRKTESIKFDLSNLENYDDKSQDVFVVSDVTGNADDSQSDTDMTLHYESSIKSPSPRKSIHSRSSKILERTLGTSMSEHQSSARSTLTPQAQRSRKSSRGSVIVQKALDTSRNSRYSQRTTKSLSDESYDTTVASAFRTRTLSPRSPSQTNMESYSIVDLVSVDSNQSENSSVYNSMRSTKSSDPAFGTPQNSSGRQTRSSIDPSLLTSSTPYVAKITRGSKRSLSSPNVSRKSPNNTSQISNGSLRRSKSLSTPENTQNIYLVNSTRVSRASRSRSRINDSDLLLISTVTDDESPKTSKKGSRTAKSSLMSSLIIHSPKTNTSASTRKTKSISSPKSPISSPKSPISSPKSPISSPKSNSVNNRKTKSTSSLASSISSPETNTSVATRKTRSISRPKSATSSPKSANNSRRTKSLSSPKTMSALTRKTKSISSPKSPLTSPKFNTSTKSRKTKSLSSPKPSSANSTRRSKSLSSPQSPSASPIANTSVAPRKSTPRSPKPSDSRGSRSISSPKTANSSRKTRSILSVTTPSDSPVAEGVSTPENRHSPVEVGTPVLSIQSLLDSSQSSLTSRNSMTKSRASLKRKTIGGIPPKPKKGRASLKSKSFNFGARRTASRLSKDSDNTLEALSATDNDIVTPKSAVKLVQEAVKNKHSTAKKPLSKRSMIDDLNESDIVKQLFNSPVKRKLSQSMTEFSRKQLFDDDEVVIRKPTRNTIALGRTPDNSILNETESYTPEVFVSPLGTPENSPNLTGIKRLFKKQTPDNDLRNVKGVKGLLRTPRTRRSIRNDLTRVSGVKNVFAKSPKNRLSDVRVKEVFAASPKNDLRRVTGVKSLFQSKKKTKSPKNDLRDVRGVKKLFAASSPVNDLRNVSGVKKVLRKNSPRNDLTDVRGVKKMFTQGKQRDSMADVSGIEELFNDSNHSYSYRDSEALFDRLIGKPPIKAVYSRTFIKKPDKPQRRRRGGSLRASLDEIIARPEEWVRKELEKRLQRPRELQKLASDTVEGGAPIRGARARDSTLARKRSAADSYSAHTLPLKKRSLAGAGPGAEHPLPLKKRALAHSTPLKGRAPPAPAPESPIASPDLTFSTTVVDVPLLQTTRRSTKTNADTTKPEVALSPKKTRAKVSKVVSPKKVSVTISPKKTIVVSPKKASVVVSPKITRKSAKNDSTAKKRATLVVAKKQPVLSPKTVTAKEVSAAKSPSPKKRTTRRQKLTVTEIVTDAEKPMSPKKTRGKRVSLVVPKPSPKMKPRAAKAKDVSNTQTSETQEVPVKSRRTRKTTAPTEIVDKKTESPQEPARATRNRKTAEVEVKLSEKATKSKAQKVPKTKKVVEEKPSAKTRGKKTDVSIEVSQKEARTTRAKRSVAVEEKAELPKRGRKTEPNAEEKPVPPKRGKKSGAKIKQPVAPKRGNKTQENEQKPVAQRRGRHTETEVEQKAASPETSRKNQAKVELKPVPKKRGRNAETVVEQKPESPKRGRKAEAKVEAAQTRGRKAEVPAKKEVKAAPKKSQKAYKNESQTRKSAASPKAKKGKASDPPQEKKTRGRKADPDVEVKPTRGASKAAVSRKRKSTSEEEVPSKVRKTRNGDVALAKGSGAAPTRASRGRPAKPAPPRARRPAAAETKRSTRGKR